MQNAQSRVCVAKSESMINMEQLGEVAKKREQTRRKTEWGGGGGYGEETCAVSV